MRRRTVASTRQTSRSDGAGSGTKRAPSPSSTHGNDERVEVDVQVRRRAEALDRGDGATAAVGDAAPPRASPLEGQHRTNEHREHAPAERLVVGERVAQPARRGEHPLPDREAAEHVIDQVCREARHAAPGTRRTETAPLARERDQQIGATLVAAEAGEAPRELPAGEKLPQLALDEARQTVTVAARAGLGEERLEVLVDEAVQRAVLGHARAVAGRREPRGIHEAGAHRAAAARLHGRADCAWRAGRFRTRSTAPMPGAFLAGASRMQTLRHALATLRFSARSLRRPDRVRPASDGLLESATTATASTRVGVGVGSGLGVGVATSTGPRSQPSPSNLVFCTPARGTLPTRDG